MKNFLSRQLNYGISPELKIQGLYIKSHDLPIISDDQCTMLLINGFKYSAIEHHKDIYNFLDYHDHRHLHRYYW